MRPYCIALFLLLCGWNSIAQDSTWISKKAMLQDIDLLIAKIEYSHVNAYHYRTKEECQEFVSQLKQELPDYCSPFDFWRKLETIFVFMNDAHTRTYPRAYYKAYIERKGLFVPFTIQKKEEQYTIAKNLSASAAIDSCSTLKAINGIAMPDIFAQLLLHSSQELDFLDENYITTSFSYLIWKVYGWESPYTIDFYDRQDKEHTIVVEGISAKVKNEADGTKQLQEVCTLRFVQDTIAVMTIRDFDQKSRRYYRRFYRKSFRAMDKHKSTILILDFRGHNGGDSRYGDDLGKYFANKPFRSSAEIQWKVTPEFKTQFAALYIPGVLRWAKFLYGINPHTKAIWHTKDNAIAVVPSPMIKPYKKTLRRNRKTYLLIDNDTFSAGSMFAAMVKDYELGTLVGQPTGSVSSFYADPIMWYQLPNSGTTFQVSTSLNIRPNGKLDHQSIVPDDIVPDAKDSLEYLLEKISGVTPSP